MKNINEFLENKKGELTYYHGNENKIHRFSEYSPPFFTTDKEYAKCYGDYVYPYTLSIKKPFDTSKDEIARNYYNTEFLTHELGNGAKYIPKGERISENYADNFWAFLSVEESLGNGFGYDAIIVNEAAGIHFKTDISIVPLNIKQIIHKKEKNIRSTP